jgi:hypothetical protein
VAMGDGSSFERNASVQWVNYEQGVHITDPLFVTALARLQWRIGVTRGNVTGIGP